MKKPTSKRPSALREPVQVYLASDDSALLASLSGDAGLSKAEVLRRGLRSFARERGGDGPMMRFMQEGAVGEWPEGVAARHDELLAEEYRGVAPRKK